MKKIVYIISLFFLGLAAHAQNIAPLVIGMPDNMLIGVTLEQRKQLIVPEKDTAGAVIVNAVGDTVKRLGFTDDYIALQTSKVGTLQVKLLSLVNNSQIIGVITTVCGPACDSRIDFYTTDWNPLGQPDLFPPITKDTFLKNDIDRTSDDFLNAYASLDMTPVKLEFSPSDKNVTAIYDIKNYLSKDDYEILKPFLKDTPQVYTWDKFAYK
ncbi:uncharacterized protein DUF3256 [Dysgonomonas alginatilytica]|uniref:Uncharacterized protein DUF3256 n=1 Tax=Dysgonomonas alginatilytica TaxID=1605892 RepID=A0A2V3PU88_9BACT|nr:DUF3256 family protein [Dysgonomonas alginatilytica]PXV67552.1 uncharacterized protein DUF3256 [Dysgonomonas alginatilytica]